MVLYNVNELAGTISSSYSVMTVFDISPLLISCICCSTILFMHKLLFLCFFNRELKNQSQQKKIFFFVTVQQKNIFVLGPVGSNLGVCGFQCTN